MCRGQTVLVTGARGFIGRHLARAFRDAGATVVGIGHGAWPEAGEWGLNAWLNGDILSTNLDVLADRHGFPDVVAHLAGGATVGASFDSPLEDFSRTSVTTARLLEWIRTRCSGARLLAASSAAVYGSGHSDAIAETAAIRPLAPYGTHKLILEELIRSYGANFGISAAILRLFSVYGQELRKQLLWEICRRLQAQGEAVLGGTGEELRDWIHVSDVARLFVLAAETASSRCPVFNGGTGVGTRIRDVANLLAGSWEGSAAIEFNGEVRRGDPFSLVADVSKARDELGFVPRVQAPVGVADYVHWFRGL